MRPRYASDSYDADKARRLRRIRRRACPELKNAYEAGTMSLRKFDLVSRGSKVQQKRIVTAQKAKTAITLLAAKAINEGTNGTGTKSTPPPSEKKVFLLSVHRLADSPWFSPQLIIRGVDRVTARKHLAAAQALLSRLHELIGELRREFPEL